MGTPRGTCWGRCSWDWGLKEGVPGLVCLLEVAGVGLGWKWGVSPTKMFGLEDAKPVSGLEVVMKLSVVML